MKSWDYEFLTYDYEFVSDCPRGYRVHDNVLCGEQEVELNATLIVLYGLHCVNKQLRETANLLINLETFRNVTKV